jgi:hypothetical protein
MKTHIKISPKRQKIKAIIEKVRSEAREIGGGT